MKKILLLLVSYTLFFSQNVIASKNESKDKIIEQCFIENNCKIRIANWIVAPAHMNVYIKKDVIEKINDNEYIINYFIKLLKETRTNPHSLLMLDDGLAKLDLSAPIYHNPKIEKNLMNANEVVLLDYYSEDIIKYKDIE